MYDSNMVYSFKNKSIRLCRASSIGWETSMEQVENVFEALRQLPSWGQESLVQLEALPLVGMLFFLQREKDFLNILSWHSVPKPYISHD